MLLSRSWDDSAQKPIFDQSETESMYAALEKYFSCRAVAMDDLSESDRLPANPPRGFQGDACFKNPRYKRVYGANRALFRACMAGKLSNISPCVTFLPWDAIISG